MKPCYGNNCGLCVWFPNGGCSEWNGYGRFNFGGEPNERKENAS